MPPNPTPIPPAFSMPGTTSGPMAPSATPIPPQVLTLGEVRAPYPGEEPLSGWPKEPNAVDIYNKEVFVPPDYAASLGYDPGSMVWQQVGGGWQPFGPLAEWKAMSPENQAAQRWFAESGNQISSSAFAQNVSDMPTMETIDALAPVLAQIYPEAFGTQDLARRGVMTWMADKGAFAKLTQGAAGMTPQDATRWQWEQEDRQQAQLDRVAEAEYRQQALAQQAQQAADAAAAQRRAQAMALAESILGMQQQQWAQVSGWALPPGSQTAPGWEEGGAVAQMFAKQGLPYTPIQAVQTPGVDYAPAYAWAQQLLGGS